MNATDDLQTKIPTVECTIYPLQGSIRTIPSSLSSHLRYPWDLAKDRLAAVADSPQSINSTVKMLEAQKMCLERRHFCHLVHRGLGISRTSSNVVPHEDRRVLGFARQHKGIHMELRLRRNTPLRSRSSNPQVHLYMKSVRRTLSWTEWRTVN